mgnify:CR=1 FL=1
MKPLNVILLLLLFVSPMAWCDNEIEGDDMPWDGEPPSEINTVNQDSASHRPSVYYDLMGRKVDNPQVGTIYIVNGKKILKR